MSVVLPDIEFKYPLIFGEKPTLICSRGVYLDQNWDDFEKSPIPDSYRNANFDWNWGGFIEFSPNRDIDDHGLKLEFFNKKNNRENFVDFIEDHRFRNDWDVPKYFKLGDYRVARLRSGKIGQYFIELNYDNEILLISTDGDKKFLYDEDSNKFTTRDKIISSIQFSEIKKGKIGDLDLYKFAVESNLIGFIWSSQQVDPSQYVDLDGDGEEEVIFTINGGGTGGSYGPYVVKLKNNNPVLIEIESVSPALDKIGKARGHEGFFIFENKLIRGHPLYKPNDANCCPSVGKRYILYKWNDVLSKLQIDKIVHLGPEWVNRLDLERVQEEALKELKLK